MMWWCDDDDDKFKFMLILGFRCDDDKFNNYHVKNLYTITLLRRGGIKISIRSL